MCYDSFYIPENMILFVIGDLDLDEVMAAVEENITEHYASRNDLPKLLIPEEPKSVREKEVRQVMNVPVPLFMIGYKDTETLDAPKEALKKTIAMKLALDMHFGRSSGFYSKNYESGLINASFFHEYSSGMQYAHVMFGGESTEYEKVNSAIHDEYIRSRILISLEEEPKSVKDLAHQLEIDPSEVLESILVLKGRSQIDMGEIVGITPIYLRV